MLTGPKPVEEPHKELRFTRGAQGASFAILGALACGAAIAILLLNLIPKDPITPWWWPLLPLPIAILSFLVAFRCVRHAYLLLTPLGIEIFPFFNARRNLRILYWSEISAAGIDAQGRLVIHFDAGHRSGVVASLAPIAPRRRPLLIRALEGRLSSTGEAA